MLLRVQTKLDFHYNQHILAEVFSQLDDRKSRLEIVEKSNLYILLNKFKMILFLYILYTL